MRSVFERRRHRSFLARGDPAFDLLADDVVAQLDAFVADEHGRPGNQLADFMLRLAAEGAIEGALAVRATQFRHKSSYGGAKRGAAVLILAPGHPITIWQLGDMGSRSEEHTSELQSLMRITYAVFCLQ